MKVNGHTAQCRAISRSTGVRCQRGGWVDSGWAGTIICQVHSGRRRNAGIVPSGAPPHEAGWDQPVFPSKRSRCQRCKKERRRQNKCG